MNTIQKFILKLKFKFIIFKMRFTKHETEADKSEWFIYERDED